MKTKYRIFISSIDAFGHINCTLGFGELLAQAGHEVTFVHRLHHAEIFKSHGFNFIPFDESIFSASPLSTFLKWVEVNLNKFRADALTRYAGWSDEDKIVFASMLDGNETINIALEKILEEHKDSFDIFIGDFVTRYPALYKLSKPYIPLFSMNPLSLYSEGPPPYSGYSVNFDQRKARQFMETYYDAITRFEEKAIAWWESCKVPSIPKEASFIDEPKHFGFYHYPEGLDYRECGPKICDKWIRVDASIRQSDGPQVFTIPESLADLPGKLIFFSLGSLGSVDVDLMRKLIDILAKSPHRFIVSKGPRGDELTLAPNMWGQNYVDQIPILKAVDMVITHGGNNTFMETLYFGKPMIVIPFFFDQFDNAQRVVDCGIGKRLNSWDLDENLLDAIEETLDNSEFKKKINEISVSMRSADSKKKAVEMIENLLAKCTQLSANQA
ncbi:uncharacterized UDP-glucosyltransferase YjiC-like [Tetranychus urticae]|uniref:UDP-glycosyltransferase 201C1 n=1 Tax=Tetranychus urticae TaxID=32264 RepID=T1JSV4_TETUR|nr:uncharacterized UDP-glucosyltransferase YjiC-like [Tetranychus urticae]AHX56862.1 UDP-glycosyltransferase 201C1 [Tetranychus urticae]